MSAFVYWLLALLDGSLWLPLVLLVMAVVVAAAMARQSLGRSHPKLAMAFSVIDGVFVVLVAFGFQFMKAASGHFDMAVWSAFAIPAIILVFPFIAVAWFIARRFALKKTPQADDSARAATARGFLWGFGLIVAVAVPLALEVPLLNQQSVTQESSSTR